MYIYIYIYIHTDISLSLYIYIYTHVYVHIHMYIYIYIYICTHIYIYVHTHLHMGSLPKGHFRSCTRVHDQRIVTLLGVTGNTTQRGRQPLSLRLSCSMCCLISFIMASCNLERVLEHGVRASIVSGSLREKTGESLFSKRAYRKLVSILQESPETSGSLRKNAI